MTNSGFSHWIPPHIATPIIRLIAIIGGVSVFFSLVNPYLPEMLGIPSFTYLLGLSWSGITQGFVWQLFTFPFFQEGGGAGITVSYLLVLTFNLGMIWMLGTAIADRYDIHTFFSLFFYSCAFAGAVTLLIMGITGFDTIVSGPFPGILSLLVAWTLCYTDAVIYFFFLIPLKAKWLAAGIIGAVLLIGISQGAWLDLCYSFTGAIFGYFYSIHALDLTSPYPFLQPLDKLVLKAGKYTQKLRKLFTRKSKKDDKIVNFNDLVQEKDDDAFVDEMLAKISRSGEKSLTKKEKVRLDKISAKKGASKPR